MKQLVTTLLAGLLLTYLSAWATLVRQDNSPTPMTPVHSGEEPIDWPEPPPPGWPSSPEFIDVSRGAGVWLYEFGAGIEVGSRRSSLGSASTTTFETASITVLTVGFPFQALRGQWFGDGSAASPSLNRGVPRPSWISSKWRLAEFLPIRPAWSGFLVNWLIYAALTGLILLGLRTARRRIRLRRGLCERCGYPLPASTARCAECGYGGATKSA
jgi:hypothetical protein